MQAKQLSPDLSVSPEITAADIPAIKAAGFKSIICNRPDGEAAGQPPFSAIEASAKAAGLAIRHQPVVPGRISESDVAAFSTLIQELPKPIFAFCRSGSRSSTLWSRAAK